MVIISLGVPEKTRSSSTVPPASRRYCTVSSMGPWPISVLPFQVPMRDFMRSNSGDTGFCVAGCSALRQTEPARSNVAQNEVICVFIVLFRFSVNCPTFMDTTNERRQGGQRETNCFWNRQWMGIDAKRSDRSKQRG